MTMVSWQPMGLVTYEAIVVWYVCACANGDIKISVARVPSHGRRSHHYTNAGILLCET